MRKRSMKMKTNGNRLGVLLFLLAVASMVAPPVAVASTYSECIRACNEQFNNCLFRCKSSSAMATKLNLCQKLYLACKRTC
ncbi:hypothetical protein LSAT2_021729 [Lamellibrachia satsuma]|nr:hypothetical protein LSAT2_021729 [Lamellibrachia satsuma]